jgi:broad-specificity NMP kinase
MSEGLVPVLWVTGPGGVGKSTVSWQIFSELTHRGVRAAFADTDQFCMSYPAPPADPRRERLKAQNLGAMVPRYRAAGAQCVIANGILDPVVGVLSDLMPQAAVTVCQLRADRQELTRRFIERDGSDSDAGQRLAETLDEADAMDASLLADVYIDTSARTASEVSKLVRGSCHDWPGFSGRLPQAGQSPGPHLDGDDNGGDVLLICGPAGVGKSTIGFQVYLRYLRGGLKAAYLDLRQIGLIRPGSPTDPGNHRLKASNLAAMWRTFHDAGARYLVATGRIESEPALRAYVGALPATTVTVCRLHAGPAELTRRIMSRGDGGSWPEPGDPLRGRTAQYLRRAADQAITSADALERQGLGTMRINTDGLTAAQSADAVMAAVSWPRD